MRLCPSPYGGVFFESLISATISKAEILIWTVRLIQLHRAREIGWGTAYVNHTCRYMMFWAAVFPFYALSLSSIFSLAHRQPPGDLQDGTRTPGHCQRRSPPPPNYPYLSLSDFPYFSFCSIGLTLTPLLLSIATA